MLDDSEIFERRSRRRLLAGDCAGGWRDLMAAFQKNPEVMAEYAEGAQTLKNGTNTEEPPAAAMLAALNRVLSKNKRTPEAWAWRGLLERRRCGYTNAVRDFDAAWTLGLRTSAILTWRGEAKIQLSQFDEGLQDLRAALDLPCRAWNHAWCGRAMITALKNRQGLKYLDRAIRLNPRYPYYYAWRAKAKNHLGITRGVFKDFQRALSLDKKGLYRDSVYGWRGAFYLKMGNPKRALADFNRALNGAHLAPVLYGRADALRQLGRLPEWAAEWDRAACLDSKYVQIVSGYSQEKIAFLLSNFESVLKNPRISKAALAASLRWSGMFLTQLQRFEQGWKNLESALRLEPTHPWTPVWLGELLLAQGRLREAKIQFSAAVKINPSNAAAYLGRARAYFASGHFQKCLREYTSAERSDPHWAQIFAERGCLRLMQGRPKEAACDLERAVARDPRCASAWVDLGVARASRKEIDTAFSLDRETARRRLSIWDSHGKLFIF